MGSAGRFRTGSDAWPQAITGGALAVLIALAAVVAARAAAAWIRVPAPAGQTAERRVVQRQAALREAPSWPVEPRKAEPRRARPRKAGPRNVEPLVPADATRILVDLPDRRIGAPAAPARRRLLALPAGAGLPALLSAAGLPPDTEVVGAPDQPGAPLPTGMQLTVDPDGRARLTPMPASRRLRLGLPLDINTASAEDLALLPRIGPRLAVRIVADRAARGPFAAPQDLLRVRGIGPATLEAIRDRVTVVTINSLASTAGVE